MVTHPSTFYSVIVINTHTAASSEGAGALSTSECGYLIRWATRVSQEAEGEPRPPATFTWRRKGMWIDYRLHIHLIYIYRFLFSSRTLTQLLLRTRTFLSHLLSFIFFVYNVTKMVTGLKLQSPEEKTKKKIKKKPNWEFRRGGKDGETGWGGEGRGGGGEGLGRLPFFAAHHWQLQQGGHSLLDARTSKRRRRRLLPRRAALPELEVLQRHI